MDTNTNEPRDEKTKDVELSDADLEQAAGGRWEWDGDEGSEGGTGWSADQDPWIAAG